MSGANSEPSRIMVLRAKLYNIEREAEDIKKGLDQLIDVVPSKFRKQLRELSREAKHIYDQVEETKGLHWKPDPNYEGPFD